MIHEGQLGFKFYALAPSIFHHKPQYHIIALDCTSDAHGKDEERRKHTSHLSQLQSCVCQIVAKGAGKNMLV
jgi:hypothetical protein